MEFIQAIPMYLPFLQIVVASELVVDQIVKFADRLIAGVNRVEAFDKPQRLTSTNLAVASISHLS